MPDQSIGPTELTPLQRARAHGMSIAGMSARVIAPHFGVHHSTISRSLKTYDDENQYKSAPRSQPRATTKQADEILCKAARADHTARHQLLGLLHHNMWMR